MKNKIFIIRLFSLPLFIFTSLSAGPFSTTNRYELSFEYHELQHKNFYTWFHSLPSINLIDTLPFAVKLSTDDQQLTFGTTGSLSASSANRDIASFSAVTATAQYFSSLLESSVKLNWYSLGNVSHTTPVDFEFERYFSGKAPPINGMFENDFTLPEAYLKFKNRNFSLTVGKEKLRWGPGYKGTLALSGTSLAPFYFYDIKLNLSSRINFSCFLTGYDDDRLYREHFPGIDSTFSTNRKTSITQMPPRYGVGQRIDIKINRHIQFGIHELCNFYGLNDFNRYCNPLQIYYLGYNSGSNEANMMSGCDVNILFEPLRIYGEFLDDDITIFDNDGNPNKFASQLGIAYYGNNYLRETGLEYTHISKYTYGHYSILNRFEYWNEPTSWPWGNDQDLFTLYSYIKISRYFLTHLELSFWIKGDGSLSDDWSADGKPDLDHAQYWPYRPTNIISLISEFEFSPASWMKVNTAPKMTLKDGRFSADIFLMVHLTLPAISVIDITKT